RSTCTTPESSGWPCYSPRPPMWMRINTRSPLTPCITSPSTLRSHGQQLARGDDAEPRTRQREDDAEKYVTAGAQSLSVLQQQHGVVAEGGEGRVAAAKPSREERADLG